jgi:hypothetical protein
MIVRDIIAFSAFLGCAPLDTPPLYPPGTPLDSSPHSPGDSPRDYPPDYVGDYPGDYPPDSPGDSGGHTPGGYPGGYGGDAPGDAPPGAAPLSGRGSPPCPQLTARRVSVSRVLRDDTARLSRYRERSDTAPPVSHRPDTPVYSPVRALSATRLAGGLAERTAMLIPWPMTQRVTR